jgi:hypothetical protein
MTTLQASITNRDNTWRSELITHIEVSVDKAKNLKNKIRNPTISFESKLEKTKIITESHK